MRSCVLALVATLGCSSEPQRAPNAAGCVPDAPCTPAIPIGPGADAGVTDAGSDSGDALANDAVTLTGSVMPLDDFTRAPQSGIASTSTTLSVHAVRAGDGVALIAPVVNGAFSVGPIALSRPFDWILLYEGSVPRTVFGVDAARAPQVVLPLYSPELPTLMAGIVGRAPPAAGTSTVVLRAIDSTGAAKKFVKATAHGAAGPYFDDGAGGIVASGATDVRGTIVYFEVPPGPFGVQLVDATGKSSNVDALLAPDAVTYAELTF